MATLCSVTTAFIGNQRNFRLVVTALAVTLFTFFVGLSEDSHSLPSLQRQHPICRRFPDPGSLAIVVKTGATESEEKVATQLSTILSCAKDVILVSDMQQIIQGHEVHDVLSKFSAEVAKNNGEFDLYRQQKQLASANGRREIYGLREMPMRTVDWRTEGHNAAWALDKYKFLHSVERAWSISPEKQWYLFIEADTYFSWPNLLRWLSTLNATADAYFGNPIRMWEHRTLLHFAHGGSGFLLSGSTVRKFMVERKGLASRWDHRIHDAWYGDYVLAWALQEELGLQISSVAPSFNSENPGSILFDEAIWCRPVITLHHMSPQQMSKLWNYEASHPEALILFSHLYSASRLEQLPYVLESWNNLPDNEEHRVKTISMPLSAKSAAILDTFEVDLTITSCERRCKEVTCLQYLVRLPVGIGKSAECVLSRAVSVGRASPPSTVPGQQIHIVSGWMKNRIAQWAKSDTCHGGAVVWPTK